MRILITGGAGSLGSNIIEKLYKDSSVEILCIDNFETGSKKNISFFPEEKIIEGSITNEKLLREIFKNSFEAYHLPYFNPHSFRNTLTAIGEMKCKNMQQLKAWSQNLGHSSINTTLISYGEVPFCQQGDLIRSL